MVFNVFLFVLVLWNFYEGLIMFYFGWDNWNLVIIEVSFEVEWDY